MTDENDNAPVFEERAYTFTLMESDVVANVNSDLTVGDVTTSIGYVTALDADFGRNGTVNYRIMSENIGTRRYTAIRLLSRRQRLHCRLNSSFLFLYNILYSRWCLQFGCTDGRTKAAAAC